MAERKHQCYVVVAIINIGTYSTKYGFSLAHAPTEYITARTCYAPLPTSILFNKEKKFLSFGNEAEDQYATLCNEENVTDYYFFRGFKLELFNSFVNDELTIKDVMGKSMSSVDVLSACIEYFRDIIIEIELKQRADLSEIGFVLTVPEVLKKPCKRFIIEAARKAGIQEDDFFIISEPEAAIIWCHHLHKNILKFDRLYVPLQTKADILVVDTGCEFITNPVLHIAVDITVNIIRRNNGPEELSQNRSWKFGSNPVDKVYRDFLSDVFGSDVMDEFKDKHGDEYTDMFNIFYGKFQRFIENETDNVNMRMPAEVMWVFEEKRGISFKDYIVSKASLKYSSSGVLWVLGAAGTSLMKKTYENFIDSLKHVLEKSHMASVPTIIMCGHLVALQVMQTLIRESFPGKYIIFPEKPVGVIMRGASLFGHGADYSQPKPKLFSEK